MILFQERMRRDMERQREKIQFGLVNLLILKQTNLTDKLHYFEGLIQQATKGTSIFGIRGCLFIFN